MKKAFILVFCLSLFLSSCHVVFVWRLEDVINLGIVGIAVAIIILGFVAWGISIVVKKAVVKTKSLWKKIRQGA